MEKILIVNDSLLQATQLKTIIEDEYDVTIALTAEDGLRRAHDEDFSLTLLDVVMPEDGFTLLKKLQGGYHHPKCSGHFDHQSRECGE